MFINHEYFKERLFSYTNKTFDLVSTIDHPYTSPPIRLIDGHNKLKILNQRGLRPYLCIWDVNKPNINNHRYELALDTGIFSTKDEKFFIFNNSLPYSLQKPCLIDFSEIKKRIQMIINRVLGSELKKDEFINNFEIIARIYQKNIEKTETWISFYENLLYDLYMILGLKDLAEFKKKSSESYFLSPLMKEWIPYCIQETQKEAYGIFELSKRDLFLKPYFRSSLDFKNQITDISYIKDNINNILSLIKDGSLIPSYEIFFWTLSLADIKHFGNDYGFFERLEKIFPNLCNKIQMTRHNEDSSYIIQFEKDRSFNCFQKNNDYIVKKNNPMKISRISSIPAIFCHTGDYLKEIISDIFTEKVVVPKIIKMGQIYQHDASKRS